MFSDGAIDRRRFVRSAAALFGGIALAGCSGASGDGSNDDGSGGASGGGKEGFGGWMEGVDNYDGVVDQTGSSEVTVVVGAEGNGGAFAFAPAAIRVSTGTTVVWEWNGEGGTHDVQAMDGGDFESELTDEEGFTFDRSFGEPRTVEYQCTPHASLGMKGVVVVE